MEPLKKDKNILAVVSTFKELSILTRLFCFLEEIFLSILDLYLLPIMLPDLLLSALHLAW